MSYVLYYRKLHLNLWPNDFIWLYCTLKRMWKKHAYGQNEAFTLEKFISKFSYSKQKVQKWNKRVLSFPPKSYVIKKALFWKDEISLLWPLCDMYYFSWCFSCYYVRACFSNDQFYQTRKIDSYSKSISLKVRKLVIAKET